MSTSSATSRWAVGTGSAGSPCEVGQRERRWCSSKAPSRARAREVTVDAGRRGVAGHGTILPLSGSPVSSAPARPRRARTVRDHGTAPPAPRPSRRCAEIAAIESDVPAQRARETAAAAGLPAVPQQRAAPPDQGPAPRRPRGGRAVGAGASAHRDVDPLEADLTDPAPRRADRRADHRDRAGARRRRPAGAGASSSRSGRPTPAAATSTSATSTPRRSTRTSPASAAA